jgi:hypothetical protein
MPQRLLLGALVAALVATAVASINQSAVRPTPAPVAPEGPASATPARDAGTPCAEALDEVVRGLRAADGTVPESAISRLQDLARGAADLNTDEGRSCKARLLLEASRAPTCGIALSAVFSSIVSSSLTLPGDLVDAISKATPECRAVMIRTLPFAHDADMALVRLVEGFAQHEVAIEHRLTAWQGLGTLGYHARKKARSDVVAHVEGALRTKLSAVKPLDEQRVPLLEAAGNAGCKACLPFIDVAANDKTTEVRAAAVGALRFVDSKTAVSRLCKATTSDPDAAVRQRGAWSLRHSGSFEVQRVTCLTKAAAQDPSQVVRSGAVDSLGVLATSLTHARSALIFLTDASHPEDTRTHAHEALAAHADVLLSDAGRH